MNEATHRLGGAADYQSAIAKLRPMQPLRLENDVEHQGGLILVTLDGEPVGRLTAKHAVARAVAGGARVLHCSANSVPGPAATPPASITARIVLGQEGETFEMPPIASPRSYPIPVVGVSYHQDAIARCAVGEPVTIEPEPDNPHDPDALAVLSARREILGHIGRDSWVQRAVHDEARECSARITLIERNEAGLLRLMLEVNA